MTKEEKLKIKKLKKKLEKPGNRRINWDYSYGEKPIMLPLGDLGKL